MHTDFNKEMFKETGLVVLRKSVDVTKMFQAAKKLDIKKSDSQVPGSPYFYRWHMLSWVQMDMLRTIEDNTGLELYPTYNYMRKYQNGAILPKHSDRYECEISFTLCIGYEGENWALVIEDLSGKAYNILLEPGDLVIYRGADLFHWRDKYQGKEMIQGFCHYVDKNGHNSHLIFDPSHDKGVY